ncbi:hypothetical protein R75461_07625 [Paraburkholderia nemoris]|nr:hypothetical protein R75461_07625 [Paraburkholderia nemoris]
MVRPVITGIAMHALVMFMHAALSCRAMCIGSVMSVILCERATGKRQGKDNKRDKFAWIRRTLPFLCRSINRRARIFVALIGFFFLLISPLPFPCRFLRF